MRKTALAGFFAFAIIIAASNSKVHAETLNINDLDSNSVTVALQTNTINNDEKPAETKPVNPEYLVVAGDNLTKIAEHFQTSWKRIYDKNIAISHPDVINVGDKFVIPLPDEQIPERDLPEVISAELSSTINTVKPPTNNTAPASTPVGSTAGNSYIRGYCTWYAKTKRPDMPNNLGNANTWVSRAAAQGLATGSAPRVGAIGQQGMHVVYVETVNADGTVTISEMNYSGWNVVNTRTVPASTFLYIY